jgi:hypothetical protein
MQRFLSITTAFKVVDFVGRINREELVINRDYQRSPDVWPVAARSFLIESILLGFPIPKITIRETTDIKTRTTLGEIVDGQQRTRAICDFFDNEFAISNRSEVIDARGCTLDSLPPNLQQAFVNYAIQADVLSGAKDADVIELFRRINSNTVALNAEERRHAGSQGEMKWFVYELARAYGPTLEKFGVLSVKNMARMADTKLMAEITHALMHGITTTNAKALDSLYTSNDKSVPGRDAIEKRFKEAFAYVQRMPELANTALAKHYHFYSLLLAIMHASNPISSFKRVPQGGKGLRSRSVAVENLLELAEVVEIEDEDDVPAADIAFWKASGQTTNTTANRSSRFKVFLKAVSK